MVIIEDSRQQIGKHNLKNEYFSKSDIKVIRSKLPFGDYALCPHIAVDTKKDIYELAMDIDQDHARFKAECVGARDHQCKLIILVENEDNVIDLFSLSEWSESDGHFQMRKKKSGNARTRKIEGLRLARACKTMSERYDVTFMFCSPQASGRMILELLGGKNES